MRETIPPELSHVYDGILSSTALKELWGRNYPSRLDQNPVQGLQDILDGKHTELHDDHGHHDCGHDHDHDHEEALEEVDEKTRFQVFMREMIRVEYGALGQESAGEDPEKTKLRHVLGRLYNMHLEASLPSAAVLSRQQRMMIDVLEHQTLQKPFRPISAIWQSLKHTAEHIKEDAIEHPKLFTALLVTCTAALLFMNRDLKSATMHVDPRLLQGEGFSLDRLAAGGDFVQNTNGTMASFERTCHDHLVQIMGQTLADLVKSAGDLANIFPKHCTKLMTGAQDAQGVLHNTYDFVTSRLAIFIETPAVSLGQSIPSSYYMPAFVESAKYNAQIVYAADTIENVMLHSTILVSSALATYAYGSLDKGEAAHLKAQVSDFIQRSFANRPLNYLFSVAAVAGTYAAEGEMTLNTAWAGVGGLVLGHVLHDIQYRTQRLNHVMKILDKALTPLDKLARSVNNILPQDVPSVDPHMKHGIMSRNQMIATLSLLGLALTNAALIGADVSGLIDTIQNQGLKDTLIASVQNAGAATAAAIVWTSYLIVNIPQDAIQHVIFGTAGVIIALPFLGVKKLLGLRNKKPAEAGHEPRDHMHP